MYKMGCKEVDESEIKLPTFVGSWIKQESFRKTSTSAPLSIWNLAMINLDNILKSRDITLLTKVHLVKAISQATGLSSSHV